MASIFTYDPDPPRVASPWIHDVALDTSINNHKRGQNIEHTELLIGKTEGLSIGRELEQPVRRLQAEPQEGPVEYKLHLLLRPRRKFRSISTGRHVSGSRHSNASNLQAFDGPAEATVEHDVGPDVSTPPSASIQQTRQHRLEQLTTQLLWRLQQSSPYHTSSATNIILPSLPEALPELQAPQQPARLLHGLEESRGALYEIGVSDDGTLVGLAEDEMQESLNNLSAMAACLGCAVEILRKEFVGKCEWFDDVHIGPGERRARRSGSLLVVEALIKPLLHSQSPATLLPNGSRAASEPPVSAQGSQLATSPTEQLRVTLTGPTMCGKSSLLGTLTTATLDNGRGKSRLSMLRHRHEISTGVTSSVTQELLGYQDAKTGGVDVINYASENIASWIDIHVAANGSRLLFITDSAGHPRYRRTTVRSLVGCAPHWTLLCIPADDTHPSLDMEGGTAASQQNLGLTGPDIDLSGAQLDLCLRLKLPLIIVITKLDVASKSGLKATLSKVLDVLKAAGRKPAMMTNPSADVREEDLQTLSTSVLDGAYQTALPLLNDAAGSILIVLTSAVQGTGISNLHSLLHELPIPTSLPILTGNPRFVFDIEDVYRWPTEMDGVVVSGRLRCGEIAVGACGSIGPFSTHEMDDSEDSDEPSVRRRPSSHLPTSRSFPGAIRNSHLTPTHFQLPNQEWRRFKVVSVRNLRLPVQSLSADQIGTLAILPDQAHHKAVAAASFARIRKGMVLTPFQPRATRSFVAQFKREDLESLAVGNHVVVYVASVRASARVVSARAPDYPTVSSEETQEDMNGHHPYMPDLGGRFEQDLLSSGDGLSVAGVVTAPNLLVTFSFDASKEFVLVGDQVLLMPGGGPGLYGGSGRGEKGVAGLDGFVGTITDTFG